MCPQLLFNYSTNPVDIENMKTFVWEKIRDQLVFTELKFIAKLLKIRVKYIKSSCFLIKKRYGLKIGNVQIYLETFWKIHILLRRSCVMKSVINNTYVYL